MSGKKGQPWGRRLLKHPHNAVIYSEKNRFLSKILLPNENGCMEWTDNLNKLGYGTFRNNKKLITAHRYSYYFHFGNFNKKFHVLHKCDNRKCMAPEHLYLGDHLQNMKDMTDKKRYKSYIGESHPHSKLNEQQVKIIKSKLAASKTHKEIAIEFGVHKTTITAISSGKNWSHLK